MRQPRIETLKNYLASLEEAYITDENHRVYNYFQRLLISKKLMDRGELVKDEYINEMQAGYSTTELMEKYFVSVWSKEIRIKDLCDVYGVKYGNLSSRYQHFDQKNRRLFNLKKRDFREKIKS